MRFAERSVLVTGGGEGIGRATALAFAAEGAKVTIVELDETRGRAAQEEIVAAGGVAHFVRADALDESAMTEAIEEAVATHGPLRHAFNNVGAPAGGGHIEDTSLQEWNESLRINVTGCFLAMKLEIPVLRDAGGGTIVNTASNTATVYTPHAPRPYAAAKAAVIQLSHQASIELGPSGIRVNTVSPGLTETPLVRDNLPPHARDAVLRESQVVQRLTQPHEIASAVLYLSADESAMITGSDVEVGGGRLF